MSRNKKNKAQQDSGSSWTSYSDMFTSLAAVFLVMFVFALIKAAVSSVKMAKSKQETKEYLEGKVPEKLQIEVTKKEQQIEKSIEEIDQYDDIIDQKIKDLNKLVKNLSHQKKIMKDLLKDKREKEVILKEVNQVVTTKNQKLEEMSRVIEQYEVQKKNITDQKNNLNRKLASLSEQLETMDKKQDLQTQSIQYLEAQKNREQNKNNQYQTMLGAQDQKIEKLKSELAQTKNQVLLKNQDIEKLGKQNAQAKNELVKLNQDLQDHQSQLSTASKNYKEALDKISEQDGTIARLQGQLGEMKGQFENLKGEYARAKGAYESQNKALGDKVKGLQGELAGLGDEYEGLKGKFGELKGQMGNMQGQMGGMNEKFNSAIAAKKQCEKQKVAVENKFKSLAKKEEAVRKIASVQESIRENIAENLAKRFREANLPVVVDKRTGNIVFQMDDLFLFQNNSYELGEGIKERLGKIIPIYADELLGKPDIAQHILRINIEGHASPTYKKGFVDPINASPEAYGYNLELSTKRATQLVQYIFGDEMAEFPFQNKMRVMTNAVGYSFSQAIKKESITEVCGEYDCPKSRRVIISFTLNNNEMIIDAFEKQKNKRVSLK